MPVCFQLYPKATPGSGPAILNKIDEEMCAHFEAPVDPVKYLNGWFDCIGFRLACGKSFDEIKVELQGYVDEEKAANRPDAVKFYEDMLLIHAWLDEHYTPNGFYSRHKD